MRKTYDVIRVGNFFGVQDILFKIQEIKKKKPKRE